MSLLLDPESKRKFADPDVTATGERRARVRLEALRTLWINTGSLCNIECAHCYIESAPHNDRLAYISAAEATSLFDEIAALGLDTEEIGFTGGEPFMNPEIIAMLSDALARGFRVLVLTNAMQPMMRPAMREGLLRLLPLHGERLTLRVSLDHYAASVHDAERGHGAFARSLAGLDWLNAQGARIAIAARQLSGESEAEIRDGFCELIARHGWRLDALDRERLVVFPEMDETAEVPEITTDCWSILGKSPSEVMCAQSRMAVKRKGAARLTLMPCTLLPYDAAFEMGDSLAAAARADGGMFERGEVKLCHPHCAKFCVLGGASCS